MMDDVTLGRILDIANCISDVPLTSLTDDAAFEPLVTLLHSEQIASDSYDDIYRIIIIEHLITFGELSIKPLVDYLEDVPIKSTHYIQKSMPTHDYSRSKVAELLGENGSDQAISTLLGILHSEERWAVRFSVMTTLAKMNNEKTIIHLSEMLLNHPDKYIRHQVARALADSAHPEAALCLILALKDSDTDVIIAAANSLGKIKPPDALPYLMEASKDFRFDPEGIHYEDIVALSAINAILNYETEQTTAYAFLWYMEHSKHRDLIVKGTSISQLGLFQDNHAIPILVEALSDMDWMNEYGDVVESISNIAQKSLKNINTPEALAALQQWKDSQNNKT